MKKKKLKIPFTAFIFSAFLVFAIYGIVNKVENFNNLESTTELPKTSFEQKIDELRPAKIIEHSNGHLSFTVDNNKFYTVVRSGSDAGYTIASSHNVSYAYVEPLNLGGTLFKVLMFTLSAFLVIFLLKRFSGGSNAVQKLIMKRPEKREIPKVTFDEIGGLHDETKSHIIKSLELFKKVSVARKMNMRPAKHMLFYGPPGTGKTQIAKAIANHLNVPFYSQSGASFVQLYVGAGALRVRELFEEAKKNAPCVVFIDEIDALASKRGTPNRSEECDRTLNEFLVHMNGVDENDQILIIGATNRYELLDEAILRPGRFDHKICINLPDAKGRKEIMDIHAKRKPFAPTVKNDLPNFAANLTGFSGADIEGLLNRAAENSLVNDRTQITQADLDYALDYTVLGAKGSELTHIEMRKRIAYHEAGHALVQSLAGRGRIRKATILPRGKALGFVAPIPDETPLYTEDEFFTQLHVSLAGGVAESLKYGKHSNGVGGDLQQVKRLIDMMIESGMGENSFSLLFDQKEINKRKEMLFNTAMLQTKDIISAHMDALELLTAQLLINDSLTGDEIDSIVHEGITLAKVLPSVSNAEIFRKQKWAKEKRNA